MLAACWQLARRPSGRRPGWRWRGRRGRTDAGVARGGEAAVFFRLFSIRMYDAMQLCFLSKLCVCRNHEKS